MTLKNNFKIGNKKITSSRTFIVAEISANHCGKISVLKKDNIKIKKN